jgi:hypothetical protein
MATPAPRAGRRLARLALVGPAVAGALALPTASPAAPITVTYQITGGTTSGTSPSGAPFLGGAAIQSGRLEVYMFNPFSYPPPVYTRGYATFRLTITATNGQGYVMYGLGEFFDNTGYRGALKTLRAHHNYRLTGFPSLYSFDEWDISASSLGNLVTAHFRWGQRWGTGYTPSGGLKTWSHVISGLTGQEISLPEPAPLPLAAAGALLASALAARPLTRRLRVRRARER